MLEWLLFALSLSAVAILTCCCATCDNCQAAASTNMEVVLAGLLNDGCVDCASLDGTYSLARLASSNADVTVNAGHCVWLYYFPGSPGCDAHFITINIYPPPSIKVEVTLAFHGAYAGKRIFWVTTPAATPTGPAGADQIDCAFSGLSVPFDRYFNPGACDGTASTATLTAL